MANQEHLEILKRGVEAWNQWRKENPEVIPNLNGANLAGLHLEGADLSRAMLYDVDFGGQKFTWDEYFVGGRLSRANLRDADIIGSNLVASMLDGADLRGAVLAGSNLSGAYLDQANLEGANLHYVTLVDTYLEGANLTNCLVYGASVWGLRGTPAQQSNLIITREDEPVITVDDLEVAQFIYLMLNNQKVRNVINTITSKSVLILGRFTPERKAILDKIREELRNKNYLPILFDFELGSDRDITETVTLLARMARFIIADLTEPSSIPKELEAIVPTLAVPVQPLLEISARPYSMFKDYWKYDWVLDVHRYSGLDDLTLSLDEKVIAPAESKARELEKRRNDALT